MTEKESLEVEIKALEEQLAPLKDKLRGIRQEEQARVSEKVERARRLQDSFTLDEIVFAAGSRCECGAGLAYPKDIGMHGSWDCSDILLGRAKPKGDPDSKMHSGAYPFAFYEIKSENQPSAQGQTTRPKV